MKPPCPVRAASHHGQLTQIVSIQLVLLERKWNHIFLFLCFDSQKPVQFAFSIPHTASKLGSLEFATVTPIIQRPNRRLRRMETRFVQPQVLRRFDRCKQITKDLWPWWPDSVVSLLIFQDVLGLFIHLSVHPNRYFQLRFCFVPRNCWGMNADNAHSLHHL